MIAAMRPDTQHAPSAPPDGTRDLTELDARLNAFRTDLADEALRGVVEAERFSHGRPARVAAARVPLFENPSRQSRIGSELLFGEAVTVFETARGWTWVQNNSDRYVGYVPAESLGEPTPPETHYVSALRTYIFSEADIKSSVQGLISMNSLLHAVETGEEFMRLSTGGWVWAGHTAPTGTYESDHAAVALRFLGTPYLWGGRSSLGLDCSALVQMAMARCGKPAPRDSDMQAAGVGDLVSSDADDATLAHGDLIFWPDHVGIWLDGGELVHANATDMMVTKGRFPEIAAKIREITGSGVTAVRRP